MDIQPLTKQQKKAARNKTYWATHHEELLDKKKQYREMKVRCSCGLDVRKNKLSCHLKQKKHIKQLEKDEADRQDLLEERTNTNITKLILEFV